MNKKHSCKFKGFETFDKDNNFISIGQFCPKCFITRETAPDAFDEEMKERIK